MGGVKGLCDVGGLGSNNSSLRSTSGAPYHNSTRNMGP